MPKNSPSLSLSTSDLVESSDHDQVARLERIRQVLDSAPNAKTKRKLEEAVKAILEKERGE